MYSIIMLSGLRRPMTTQSLQIYRREIAPREKKLGLRPCASAPAIVLPSRTTGIRPKSQHFRESSSESTKILRLRSSAENKRKYNLASAS